MASSPRLYEGQQSNAHLGTFAERDFGAGIDQQSPPNQIPPSFIEDAVNADPMPTGSIKKRKGFQGYAGNIPVRVVKVTGTAATDVLEFGLDNSIDLSLTRSTPVIVYGRLSAAASGDLSTTDSVHYYSTIDTDARRVFAAGTSQTITIPASEHSLGTAAIWAGLASADDTVNSSNTVFYPSQVSVNKSTFDVTITYDNLTGLPFSGYVYLADRSNNPPTSYFGDDSGNPNTTNSLPVGTSTYTITLAEHNLSSSQIIAKVFEDNGTSYVEIVPDTVTVGKATSQVSITLTNATGSSKNIIFSLSVAPTANYKTGAVATGTTNTVTVDLSAYTGNTNFVQLVCYADNGVTLTQVIPNTIAIDTTLNTLSISFTDSGSGGAGFSIYWQFIAVTTNKLRVVSSTNIASDFLDSSPQLTLWGLDHSEIYGTEDSSSRAGWATHIDSYRSNGESRLITGLGGVLFSDQFSSEGTNSTDFLLPTELYPSLQGLVASDSILAPAFWDTGETPGRTRGFITGDTGSSHFFQISSVTWDSGNGWVKYVVSVPSMLISGTLGTIISTSGIKDVLLIQDTSYKVHNGSFSIEQVTTGVNELNIWVSNLDVNSSDFNIAGAGGEAGIFTDRVTLSSTSLFLAGDGVKTDLITDTSQVTCLGSSGTTLALDGITEILGFPTGLKVVGNRSSEVIPIRNVTGVAGVTNLVRGDMLSYSGIARHLRIKHINELSDVSITIGAGDGETALITLGSGTSISLWVGEKILIRGGAHYEGVYEIASIISNTVVEINSSILLTDSAVMVGKTIHLDEAIHWYDTTDSSQVLAVISRWIPIEAPDDSWNLTAHTHPSYFNNNSYTAQPILRSTMVKNSLYLTNGDDEVYKFDGSSIYRAGLFRWQPNLFLSVDSGTTGKIDISPISISYTAHANNQFTVSSVNVSAFPVGTRVIDSIDGASYVVQSASGTTIYVDRTISSTFSGTPTLSKTIRFKYYFRLNAVDANDSIIASAIAGSDDFVAELGLDSSVRIRLVGMPAWDIYDYDRLEVQIYRTKGDTTAPFYRLSTIPLSFNSDTGYLDYIDTDSDSSLIDLDEVSTALTGAELGTAWEEPLRAKYVTSAGNRLILANVRDYPSLDVQITKNVSLLQFTDLVGLRWLLRRDNEDTGTTTDMVSRAAFEYLNVSSAKTVSGITATTSAFTVTTTANHGLSIGSWVYLFRNSVSAFDLKFSGWHQVATVPTLLTFTVNYASDGVIPATYCNRCLISSAPADIPVPLGIDGNYGMLNGNKSSTVASSYEFLAARRLADAINVSMRKTDKSLTNYSSFTPWVIANAGNEFNSGQVILKQPKHEGTFLELKLPAFSSTIMDIFVNASKRVPSAEVGAVTKLFPSRILISYPNFPEIFDAPTALRDIDSASAVDVNSADGQEVTAVIPFFGSAAFGAAQQSGVVVVFKTNSIYLVDLAAKDAGTNPVQKIESQGKGCTAPYSVTVTRDGIMFANETGLYRLNKNLQIDYVGRKYEKKFQNNVVKNYLSIAAGHHDAINNKYKLSYVTGTDTSPSEVAVYNHVREYESQSGKDGSWTTYDSHKAIGWANLQSNQFFASTIGRVFSIRNGGDETDYRDDSSAIAMEIVTRANDFGDAGIRKIVRKINTHFIGENSVGTTLKVGRDLTSNFESSDAFIIRSNADTTGLGDTGTLKINTIQISVPNPKGLYFQLKIENSTIDEGIEVVGFDWRVTGLSDNAVTQAASTK